MTFLHSSISPKFIFSSIKEDEHVMCVSENETP